MPKGMGCNPGPTGPSWANPLTVFLATLEEMPDEVDGNGLLHGYYATGEGFPDCGLWLLIGVASHLLHSGDAEFARRHVAVVMGSDPHAGLEQPVDVGP